MSGNTFILQVILKVVFLLLVVLHKLFFGSVGIEDTAESLVTVVLFTPFYRLCLGDDHPTLK